MNSDPQYPMDHAVHPESGQETLRLIASLPAPAGLEERVHKALRDAPRRGQLVAWPAEVRSRVSLRSNSMRAAAAAAIVFVVVGGGWGIYTRVAPVQSGNVVTMPARVPGQGGFAGAGAIRTPETLPGPTVSQPATKPDTLKKKHTAPPAANESVPQAIAR